MCIRDSLATQQELETQLASLEQDRTTLEATRASLQTEVAALIAIREQLTGEKAALSDELAGVTAESQAQLEQLTVSEGLREQLALDLTDLNNALASLQAEQSRLMMAYEM